MILNKSLLFLGYLFFFLILVIPSEHMEIKMPFVLIFTLIGLFKIFYFKQSNLYRPIFILISIIILKGVIWTIIGIFNNNRGVFDVIKINIVWYVLFTLFMLLIKNPNTFYKLLVTLIIASFFIVIFDILYILMVLGFIPDIDISFLYNPKEFNFSIYLDVGFSYLTANNINNLVFVYPLTIAMLLLDEKTSILKKKIPKIYIIILLILEIILSIFSGRRILFLTILITPFYLLLFSFFLKTPIKRKIYKYLQLYVIIIFFTLFFLINYLLVSLDFSFESLFERFSAAFDSDKESIRFEQSNILFENFLTSPLIGHGAGAEIINFQRSSDRPWSFEMSYYDDLFKTGIIGFMLFTVFIIGIFWKGIYFIKKENDILMIGLLAGLFSTLVANASNPFLSSFDCFWMMFLPIIYINIHGLSKLKAATNNE